jgi:hypothetical protein
MQMVDARTPAYSPPRLSRSPDDAAHLNPLLAPTHEPSDTASASGPALSRMLVVRLCLVGFLCNCQPSEPFLARYLIEDKVLMPISLGVHNSLAVD